MEQKTLLQKMNIVMSNINNIEKDKTNEFHRYKYASEEAIKRTLHKELTDQGIIFKMDIVDITTQQTQTEKGTSNLVYAKCKYQFLDAESDECMDGEFYGCGEDKLDKALYKATTGAIKYILTTTFLIPTGDDPENDNEKQIIDRLQKAGFEGKEVKPLGSNKVTCKDCGSEMIYKKKIKKSDGSKYAAYFCPNQSYDNKDKHKMFGYEVIN